MFSNSPPIRLSSTISGATLESDKHKRPQMAKEIIWDGKKNI